MDTGIHGYRDIGIQGYMDKGIQGYRDTGIQGFRHTKMNIKILNCANLNLISRIKQRERYKTKYWSNTKIIYMRKERWKRN